MSLQLAVSPVTLAKKIACVLFFVRPVCHSVAALMPNKNDGVVDFSLFFLVAVVTSIAQITKSNNRFLLVVEQWSGELERSRTESSLSLFRLTLDVECWMSSVGCRVSDVVEMTTSG